jgi:DNA polymerase V
VTDKVFALVDCNSFYCSCERVFRPQLNNKPIIVLSNNDGCAVARTDEAKAIGIEMGAPYFKIKDLIKKHNVHVFSSNYTLYGDLSHRVMSTLSEFTPEMEIYSIDEAFLSFNGMNSFNLLEVAKIIRKRVLTEIGIPTCVGIGPTKVLAKVANHVAKKNKIKTGGVFDLRDENLKNEILKNFSIGDVWGVGRQSTKKLNSYKIFSAFDLMNADSHLVQKLLTIQGRRIQDELKGVSCIDLELIEKERKQIVSSRSFGRPVFELNELSESVANHVTAAAEKLRRQKLITCSITVFVQTNPFKATPQYYNSATMQLLTGSSVTPKLIQNAQTLLHAIYRKPYEYKKCGIILNDLRPKSGQQVDFFGFTDTVKEDQFMNVVDELNSWHGKGSVKFAACGIDQFWQMLSKMKSQNYTTRWSELLKVG